VSYGPGNKVLEFECWYIYLYQDMNMQHPIIYYGHSDCTAAVLKKSAMEFWMLCYVTAGKKNINNLA
jgi:hypothetical protein